MDSNRKRIIILAIYFFVFVFAMWLIYSATRPKETCSDGIKNQNEEEVDCGGVCAQCKKVKVEPITIGETGVIASGVSGEYDFYGLITNPNNILGSSQFNYVISVYDSVGSVIAKKEGENFILPGEKKYIIENNIQISAIPSRAELVISNPVWEEFNDYYQKPQIEIVNKHYSEITSGIGFAEATGLLKNKSPFDFETVKIEIILKNNIGKIVGLNSTIMKTVRTGEERDFRSFWPNRFPGADSFQEMETQIEINVFKSDSFAKRYFAPEKFQENRTN